MNKSTQLKRWCTITNQSQSQNPLQTKPQQFGSSIPLNLLKSISALKRTTLTTISQTARPADLYLLHVYLMRKGPERNFKYDLALCIIKFYPISTVIEALEIVHLSLCDSLTFLCITVLLNFVPSSNFIITHYFCAWGQYKKLHAGGPRPILKEFH